MRKGRSNKTKKKRREGLLIQNLLNASRSEILIEIKVRVPMDDPKPLKLQEKKTRTRINGTCFTYYWHDMEYCWDLNKVFSDPDKKGKLDKYHMNCLRGI